MIRTFRTRWLAALLVLLAAAAAALPLAAQQAPTAPPAAQGGPSPQTLLGDVNGDGQVTVLDALAVLSFVVGHPLPAGYLLTPNADANGDGQVTAMDALVIAGYAMGKDVSRFPVGAAVRGADGDAMECTVDVRALTMGCRTPRPGVPAGAHGLILGGQNLYVRLSNTGNAFDGGTRVFSSNVRLTNLIPQALGVDLTGATDPTGIQVFFNVLQPSGVTVVNADGMDTFLAPNQKYFQYAGGLAQGDSTAARSWQWHLPVGVEAFTFKVYVSTPVKYPDGWIDVTPTSRTLQVGGGTQALVPTVRNALGVTIPGATVSWGSSDPAVATVDGSGVVTATGDGTATITASTSSPTRTGTATITVSTPAAAQSVISASPTSLAAGDTSVVTVQAKNAAGANILVGGATVVLNTDLGVLTAVTDNADGTYTARLTSTTPGAATVSGTLNGGTIGTTAGVTFTNAAPASIAQDGGDGQSATVNTSPATAPTVKVTDAFGNPVAGVNVTFAVTAGGGSVNGTPVATDAGGIAAAVGWTLGTTAGGNTLTATAAGLAGSPVSFTATGTAGAASQIVLVTPPAGASSGSAFGTQPVLQLQDQYGNPVSTAGVSVTVAITAGTGGALGGTTTVQSDGNGTITFANLAITGTAGSFTLGFTSPGLTGASSGAFTVGPGAAAKLSFTAQPSSAAAGSTLGTITVTVQDASSNTVTGSSASITLAIGTNPGSGTLSGTATQAASGGVATFTGLSIDKVGTGYTLGASSAGLTGATSGTFNVTPGAAASIVFGQQPTSALSGAAISPAITVTVRDANGNLVANGTSVSMSILNNAGSPAGTLSGTTSATTTSGVATFGSLSIDKAGTGYTLQATSGAANAASGAFNISAAAATTLTALSPTTQTTPAGAGCKNQLLTGTCAMPLPSVKVTDANGNPVAGVSVTFTLTTAISGNKGELTVNGVTLTTTGSSTVVVTDATGTITAQTWKSAQSNGANTATAAATGLTNSPITFSITTVN